VARRAVRKSIKNGITNSERMTFLVAFSSNISYYLGPKPFDKNFLRKLQPQEVPEDKGNCFCRFSVKVHGEEGCEGGGPCLLPCSHILG
jgi:hypothetical protein